MQRQSDTEVGGGREGGDGTRWEIQSRRQRRPTGPAMSGGACPQSSVPLPRG